MRPLVERAPLPPVRQKRSSPKHWQTAVLRIVAALAALLIGSEHSLASLHQALTAHAVCAEHGELVHADSAHGEALSRAAVPAVEPGASAEAEHHHCGTVPAAPLRAPAATAATVHVSTPYVAIEPARAPKTFVPAPDVLGFAPKLSPPV